jgi:hypothetical protein
MSTFGQKRTSSQRPNALIEAREVASNTVNVFDADIRAICIHGYNTARILAATDLGRIGECNAPSGAASFPADLGTYCLRLKRVVTLKQHLTPTLGALDGLKVKPLLDPIWPGAGVPIFGDKLLSKRHSRLLGKCLCPCRLTWNKKRQKNREDHSVHC